MYKLIGSPRTRAGRVMWLLEELGAPYELESVFPHTPEVTAKSPLGKVPVLVDGDLVVSDSTAIMFHLADRHGKLTFPAGSPERARMMSVMFFALDDLERPVWTAARHDFLLPKELRRLEEIRPSVEHELRQGFAALANFLGDGPFVMGETFTIADILIGHIGGWAKGAKFETPGGAVGEYMARVRGRPGWQAVLSAIKAKAG